MARRSPCRSIDKATVQTPLQARLRCRSRTGTEVAAVGPTPLRANRDGPNPSLRVLASQDDPSRVPANRDDPSQGHPEVVRPSHRALGRASQARRDPGRASRRPGLGRASRLRRARVRPSRLPAHAGPHPEPPVEP
jgi:hypothetical protein